MTSRQMIEEMFSAGKISVSEVIDLDEMDVEIVAVVYRQKMGANA